ncbi:leucyl aminopeptidase [bacterium]|nr:leucyl aminopeptidase [bacterium]
MIEIERSRTPAARTRVEMLALPLRSETEPGPEIAALDESTGGRLLAEVRRRCAEPAKRGSTFAWQTHGEMPQELVAVIGLGVPAGAEPTAEDWRRFAGAAVAAARQARVRSLGLSVAACARPAAAAATGAVIEGALLATYRFAGFRSSRSDARLVRCVVAGSPATRAAEEAERRARVLAEATAFARDLVNLPAETVTPAHLAAAAQRVARSARLSVKVLGPRELRRLGMGAILAVGRASRNEPRLIEIVYRPRSGRARRGAGPIVLVGKGITFDSGGLSLKPAASMEIQKRDMAGGAAVLGAMRAIGRLAPPVEVRGYVAAAENMPGGDAYRPGDVLRTCIGKTIEVLNTDAEGRLVLADALGYATRPRRGSADPSCVVDLATLTGAVTTALGRSVAAVLGNDADVVRDVIEAGRVSGEPIWELPLVDEYMAGLDSPIADLRNTGDGTAGTIYGGLFLREFVHRQPWAHLDIAGVAFTDKGSAYVPRGAVGWGVRTLVDLVERRSARA